MKSRTRYQLAYLLFVLAVILYALLWGKPTPVTSVPVIPWDEDDQARQYEILLDQERDTVGW